MGDRDVIYMDPNSTLGTLEGEEIREEIEKAFADWAKTVIEPMGKALAIVGDENIDTGEIRRILDEEGVTVMIFVNGKGRQFAQCTPQFLQTLMDHSMVIGPSRHGKTAMMEALLPMEKMLPERSGPDYLRHDPTKNHRRRQRRR